MTFAEQISIISFAVILVFCMAAYLRSHSRYENGIFHKASCCLLYKSCRRICKESRNDEAWKYLQ